MQNSDSDDIRRSLNTIRLLFILLVWIAAAILAVLFKIAAKIG